MRTHWTESEERLIDDVVHKILTEELSPEDMRAEVRDISDVTGRSKSAVRSKISRAFKPLNHDAGRKRGGLRDHWQARTKGALDNLRESAPHLVRHGLPFRWHEDEDLLSCCHSLWVEAIAMGRTYRSVESRRAKLLKERRNDS